MLELQVLLMHAPDAADVLQVLGPDAPEVAITSAHLGDVACALGLNGTSVPQSLIAF